MNNAKCVFVGAHNKKIMLGSGPGEPTVLSVELAEEHLTIGCYTITREAFEYLAKEWQDFLTPKSRVRKLQ